MTNSKAKLIIAIAVNIAVIVLGIIGDVMDFGRNGLGMLGFYTIDSNIFAQIACAVTAVFLIKKLVRGGGVPGWVTTLKYMSACCVAVTFTVVVAVLAPMSGSGGYGVMLFSSSMLYLHFLCPLLTVVSCIFLDGGQRLPKNAALIALIPTALYALTAGVLNLTGAMHGPYPFLCVYEQPWWMSVIWLAVILCGAWLLALIIQLAADRAGRPPMPPVPDKFT